MRSKFEQATKKYLDRYHREFVKEYWCPQDPRIGRRVHPTIFFLYLTEFAYMCNIICHCLRSIRQYYFPPRMAVPCSTGHGPEILLFLALEIIFCITVRYTTAIVLSLDYCSTRI